MTTKDELLAEYDAQLRRRIPGHPPAGQSFRLHGPVLRVVGQHRGFIETARDVGVSGAALDALIAKHRDFFAARGEAVEWKTRAHDRPADLPARLMAAGFVAEDSETVLIGETARMPVDPELPDGVSLREVHERHDFERIADLESEVWGEDFSWMTDDLHGRVISAPDEIVVLLAEAERQVVSAAWLVFKPGTDFAGLWGGSTVQAWRDRGIYRALVARRAQLARTNGVKYLQVDASKDSTPILGRMGLEAVTMTTPYVWSPAQA